MDDVAPSAYVEELLLGRNKGEGVPRTAVSTRFHYTQHYQPGECAAHHEIERFSSTPLGSGKNTSIVVMDLKECFGQRACGSCFGLIESFESIFCQMPKSARPTAIPIVTSKKR